MISWGCYLLMVISVVELKCLCSLVIILLLMMMGLVLIVWCVVLRFVVVKMNRLCSFLMLFSGLV